MKQVVVLSGKGGTGKTSIVACLAQLAADPSHRIVTADCDVDAANLALLIPGEDESIEVFEAGRRAKVEPESCTGCGICARVCRFEAIRMGGTATIDPLSCEGCGVCGLVCQFDAISFQPNQAGWWMKRSTVAGPLIHARLGVAQDNSGKLVTKVRSEATEAALRDEAGLVLIDGPPGIGCPVHASLTGCDLAVIVTEPTPSGEHDLRRVLELLEHFEVDAAVLINKCNLSPDNEQRIEELATEWNVPIIGRLPFDVGIPRALAHGVLPLEVDAFVGPMVTAWHVIQEMLKEHNLSGAASA